MSVVIKVRYNGSTPQWSDDGEATWKDVTTPIKQGTTKGGLSFEFRAKTTPSDLFVITAEITPDGGTTTITTLPPDPTSGPEVSLVDEQAAIVIARSTEPGMRVTGYVGHVTISSTDRRPDWLTDPDGPPGRASFGGEAPAAIGGPNVSPSSAARTPGPPARDDR
jgi:hypothetical protein